MIFLGDGWDSIGSFDWRNSGRGSRKLRWGHFLTSLIKSQRNWRIFHNFRKIIDAIKSRKTDFVNPIIHHYLLRDFDRHDNLNTRISNGPLFALKLAFQNFCILQAFLVLNNIIYVLSFFESSALIFKHHSTDVHAIISQNS